MSLSLTPPGRRLRFALPPSLGPSVARDRADRLERFLTRALSRPVEVTVAPSYDALSKDVLSSRVDAAWAPPFVCARMEAMGVRVLVRGVRRGSSAYRSVLLCRVKSGITLERLSGQRAAWVDQESIGGYLLPLALLKARGIDPARTFFSQSFFGSYRDALDAVHGGRADVGSIFCAPAAVDASWTESVEEVLPGRSRDFTAIAFTDESPNDGVVVSMMTSEEITSLLERALIDLSTSPDSSLLTDTFRADRFEPAPRLGYRALYRVAHASL